MPVHAFVGVADAVNRYLVHARYVHRDAAPQLMVPALRGIWAGAARRDTSALIGTLLACDWYLLDPATTVGEDTPVDCARRRPGIGLTSAVLTGTHPAAGSDPEWMFPLSRAGDFDGDWTYLLHPDLHIVSVHTGDGEPRGAYPLSGARPRRRRPAPRPAAAR